MNMTQLWLEHDRKFFATTNLNIGTRPENWQWQTLFRVYSLDRIKITEWIWPNYDNDKPYFRSYSKVNDGRLKAFILRLAHPKHLFDSSCKFFRSCSPNFVHIHSVMLIQSCKYSSLKFKQCSINFDDACHFDLVVKFKLWIVPFPGFVWIQTITKLHKKVSG